MYLPHEQTGANSGSLLVILFLPSWFPVFSVPFGVGFFTFGAWCLVVPEVAFVGGACAALCGDWFVRHLAPGVGTIHARRRQIAMWRLGCFG